MLYNKSQFFAFVLSFSITFVVGFFAWDVFLNSGFTLKTIGSNFFTAGLQNEIQEIKKSEEIKIEEIEPDSQEEIKIIISEPTREDILDDIAEKLDIISQQAAELEQQATEQQQALKAAESQKIQEEFEAKCAVENYLSFACAVSKIQKDLEREQTDRQDFDNESSKTSVGGGGLVFYSKILISEIQIEFENDEKQEFVEFYNPNNDIVDMTGWYLQKKTASSSAWLTYAPKSLFSGKIILPKAYFLIARTGYYQDSADVFTDNAITENNAFVLKNPGGEISDKLGFGLASDFEMIAAVSPSSGQSIGRKFLAEENAEQDINNNLEDFELQTPTPKSQNVAFVEPPVVLPEERDITPPEIIFATLDAVQNKPTFPINFEITDMLGTVTPSGIDSYVFQWQKEGDLVWQQDSEIKIDGSPINATGTRDFTGEYGKTYNFQIRVKDRARNISDWLPETPAITEISVPKILINEIQTWGTTANDEFVELYNPNNFDVDLLDFSLEKETSGGTESPLVAGITMHKIISALKYFLIVHHQNEDGSEAYKGSATLDLRFSGKSYYLTNNNTVLLYSNCGTLLDKVGFGSAADFEGSPAPDPNEGQSIQRKELGVDTDDNSEDFSISDPTPQGSQQ